MYGIHEYASQIAIGQAQRDSQEGLKRESTVFPITPGLT
jgi:hypothetical protein